MFKLLSLCLPLVIALTSSNPVFANTIVNGNFDTDLSDWTAITSLASDATVQWDSSGKVMLSTGTEATPATAVLIQGDAGDFSFTSPILIGTGDDLLKFDFEFMNLGVDPTESSYNFTDNLQVWIYDADGINDQLVAEITQLNLGLSSVTFDLSGYTGHSIALSFELNDEYDGFDSRVYIDNVRIEASPVPVPAAVWFELTGLLGFAANWKRRNG